MKLETVVQANREVFPQFTITKVVDAGDFCIVFVRCDDGYPPFQMPYKVEEDGTVSSYNMFSDEARMVVAAGKIIYLDEAPLRDKLPETNSAGSTNDTKADGSTPLPADDLKAGVGVIVVKDGKILTGTRKTDFGYGLICGPGGHIKVGETPTQAAFRETEEEFGISPKELTPVGRGPAEPDTEIQPYIFLCTDYEGEPNCVDREMAESEFRTLEELEQLRPSLFQPFSDGVDVLKAIINSPDDPDTTDPDHDDGGPGSGNHGHEGVPGQVGGSAPSGDAKMSKDSFQKGKGDFELTGDVTDLYLTETARARVEGLVKTVKTASDLENYLKDQGIKLETSYEPLRNAMGKEIRSVKEQADYVIAAVEQYKDLGGLTALKAVHIYEPDLDAQAQYSYRAKGEEDVPDEGHLHISDRATGKQVMHEFAHAFADSTKPEGFDVVEWSAKLNKEAGLPDRAGTYLGANADVREAERFADAMGGALTYGEGTDNRLSFAANVANIVNGVQSKCDGGPGSGNFGHEGRAGEVGGSAPDGSADSKKSTEKTAKLKEGFKHLKPNQKYAYISRSGVVPKGELESLKEGIRAGDQASMDKLAEYEQMYFDSAEYGRTVKSLDVEMRDEVAAMSDADAAAWAQKSMDRRLESHEGWANQYSAAQKVAIDMAVCETPQVVSREDFDKYVKDSGAVVCYRGVKDIDSMTGENMQFQMAYNTQEPYFGDGIFGDGLYFSTRKDTAESYAGRAEISTCAVRPDAKILEYGSPEHDKAKKRVQTTDDSVAALCSGYDVIHKKQGSNEDYYVILNRAALVMVDPVDDLADVALKALERNTARGDEKTLDFSPLGDTIKSKGITKDGAPKGNDNAAGPHKRSHLSSSDKARYRNRIVGQKTSDGVQVKGFSDHAFDRIAQRNLSPKRIEDMLRSQNVSPDKTYQNRRCYDVKGSRLVLDHTTGTIVTIEWRKQNR